jgi:Tol biopolymer transport system component
LKFSRDGARAAIVMFPPGTAENNDDIWIQSVAGGSPFRLTSSPAVESQPTWSPDGSRVGFVGNAGGSWAMYQQPVSGGGAERICRLTGTPGSTEWSRDGRFILVTLGSGQTRGDIWAVPVSAGDAGGCQPIPILNSPASERAPSLSADGRWLAYVSDATGRDEVYVRRFDVSASGVPSAPNDGRPPISNGARNFVRFRRDDRELIYVSTDGRAMSVDIAIGSEFKAGPPKALFTFPESYLRQGPMGLIDMTPDASRFLIAMPVSAAIQPVFHVLVNWQ